MVHGQRQMKRWEKRIGVPLLPPLIALLLLCSHSGVLLAAPRAQQPQPTVTENQVYGLMGLLEPAEDEPANTLLYTDDAIHPVVGATPALDERLRWLATQTPPAQVKLWGQWVGPTNQAAARQIVVTGVVVVNAVQDTDRAWAVGDVDRVNVRSRPAADAPPVGQLLQGESYRIVGADAATQWWLICCFDGETAWVQQSLVAVEGTTATVPVVTTSGVTPATTAGTPFVTTPVTVPVITAVTTPVTAPAVAPTTTDPTAVIASGAAPIVVTPPAPSTTVTPVGAAAAGATPTPVVTLASAPLWQAAYFAGTDLAGQPVATELVTEVDFAWGSNAPVPQLPVDSFSARFDQTVPLVAGFYTLRAQADDGVRVYVNDELVIDEWHTGEPPAYTAGRQLSGLTTFRVEYYESGGQAGLQFEYSLADTFPDWRAEYYDNITLAGDPAWVQPEPLGADVALSRQWSLTSPVPDVLPDNNWSARWTGTFFFEGGNYIFRAEANDGVRVWIDGIQVINQWQDGSNQAETVFEDIGAGNHEITVEYYERGGIANLKVDWARIVQPD